MHKSQKIYAGILAATALTLINVGVTNAQGLNNQQNILVISQQPISDDVITAQVKQAFLESNVLRNSTARINIVSKDKVVYLSGKVDNKAQYSEAVYLAETNQNVTNVNANDLRIGDSQAPMEDTYITAKIKALLFKAGISRAGTGVFTTHVETKNGIVYLRGSVDNSRQIHQAIKIAKSVKGVKKVISFLKTK